MSAYEFYDATSSHYDQTRRPVGVSIVRKGLRCAPSPAGQRRVLDAGCGTGNYLPPLLPDVARIEAVDMNRSMLAQAASKSRAACDWEKVRFREASVLALPFDAGAFDAVMANQMLHHLPDRPDDGFPLLYTAVREFARVLKPNGILIINTSSQAQCRDGFWFYRLIPEAAEAIGRRFAPIPLLSAAIREAGFDLIRLDERPPAGLIDNRLRVEIRACAFLVADLTDRNAGAYWEAGFAEALGKPVIYMCREDVFREKATHFDTNHSHTIVWNPEEPEKTAESLKATIRATLPEEAVQSDPEPTSGT